MIKDFSTPRWETNDVYWTKLRQMDSRNPDWQASVSVDVDTHSQVNVQPHVLQGKSRLQYPGGNYLP